MIYVFSPHNERTNGQVARTHVTCQRRQPRGQAVEGKRADIFKAGSKFLFNWMAGRGRSVWVVVWRKCNAEILFPQLKPVNSEWRRTRERGTSPLLGRRRDICDKWPRTVCMHVWNEREMICVSVRERARLQIPLPRHRESCCCSSSDAVHCSGTMTRDSLVNPDKIS